MIDDMRNSPLYLEAEAMFRALTAPGSGQICDAADLTVSEDGLTGFFAATISNRLDEPPATKVCRIDMSSSTVQVVTFGPNSDRRPRFSSDGSKVAFLSDRERAGDFQLYILDSKSNAAVAAPRVDGWIEYHHWSPDGSRLLLGVAGHGADIAGGQGAITSAQGDRALPRWLPDVTSGDEAFRWRSVWMYDIQSGDLRRISAESLNVWEANWCGNAAFTAVTSSRPEEGFWYNAELHRYSDSGEAFGKIHCPTDQIGCLSCSPDGHRAAFVEAICSDRWVVAGQLMVVDLISGITKSISTNGIDVTHTEWRSSYRLLVAGHRNFESVVGVYDAERGSFDELWKSSETSTGGFYLSVAGFGDQGDCALIGEGFRLAPEVGLIRSGAYESVKSFEMDSSPIEAISGVDEITWLASDGLAIQGWLLKPNTEGPYPLIVNVHGGPVHHWRSIWLGRRNVHLLMLLKRGFAIFMPNPRGSIGRGQPFIQHVVGDMGGSDADDILSGIDHLITQGLADGGRIGVTGASYGGFMSAWLITQDSRFAAAVPVAPVTNHVTEHLISNIPEFVAMFLADKYENSTGRYFSRSPIMHASKASTPTMNICGALDRCTPPEEAVQFHNALVENGVRSVLVTYPEEGHGIRRLPALIDYSARIVSWFTDNIEVP